MRLYVRGNYRDPTPSRFWELALNKKLAKYIFTIPKSFQQTKFIGKKLSGSACKKIALSTNWLFTAILARRNYILHLSRWHGNTDPHSLFRTLSDKILSRHSCGEHLMEESLMVAGLDNASAAFTIIYFYQFHAESRISTKHFNLEMWRYFRFVRWSRRSRFTDNNNSLTSRLKLSLVRLRFSWFDSSGSRALGAFSSQCCHRKTVAQIPKSGIIPFRAIVSKVCQPGRKAPKSKTKSLLTADLSGCFKPDPVQTNVPQNNNWIR